MGGIPWTTEEDQLLRKCIEKYGEGKWHGVPHLAGLRRCRKSCRLRWLNYLRPNIKRGSFEQDEVDLIIKLQRLLGNRWSLVAARLPGRTGNDVKNYWNCHLSKKLTAQEADDDQEKISHNPHVIPLPQPPKISKSNSKRLAETSRTALEDQSFPAMEESSRSGSMAMLCNVDDEDKGQMVQIHEQVDSNNTCVEKDHDGNNDFLGDLGLVDLDEFEQDQYDQVHNSKNKWVWDDSILDMDLWSTDSS